MKGLLRVLSFRFKTAPHPTSLSLYNFQTFAQNGQRGDGKETVLRSKTKIKRKQEGVRAREGRDSTAVKHLLSAWPSTRGFITDAFQPAPPVSVQPFFHQLPSTHQTLFCTLGIRGEANTILHKAYFLVGVELVTAEAEVRRPPSCLRSWAMPPPRNVLLGMTIKSFHRGHSVLCTLIYWYWQWASVW